MGLSVGGKLDFDDDIKDGNDTSPIKRPKCDMRNGGNRISTKVKSTAKGKDSDEKWTAYREENNPENVLNDSLEDSSSSSGSSTDSPCSQGSDVG